MSTDAEPRLGLSGAIAKKFLLSEITPLLALVGLLMGIFAVLVTPREEEPQINVTFANVFIAFPGATAQEVEKLVSTPAEQVLAEIEGTNTSTQYPGPAWQSSRCNSKWVSRVLTPLSGCTTSSIPTRTGCHSTWRRSAHRETQGY